MNPTESLRDIYGLESVSWWPLASGWWVIIGVIIVFLLFLLGFWIYRYFNTKKQPTDWRQVALTEWTAITTEPLTSREQLVRLATLLRRIAMQRYGRQACAGLNGEQWLTWLTEHDPQGFNWQQTGQLLLELPYKPDDISIAEAQLCKLQQAVYAWII